LSDGKKKSKGDRVVMIMNIALTCPKAAQRAKTIFGITKAAIIVVTKHITRDCRELEILARAVVLDHNSTVGSFSYINIIGTKKATIEKSVKSSGQLTQVGTMGPSTVSVDSSEDDS
jgi:hypothetical protein